MPDFEEYCEEIRDLWDSHMLTNMGAKHKKFQKELEEFMGIPHATLFTNGHLALENAIAAFQFPRGSEVITTPFTFVSTTSAITRNGLVPVFCDISPKTYTLDPAKIEALITDKTVAIVPVHVYGKMCDVEGIQEVADRHGLKVIYDAAHAFGVTYKGVSSACFGDAAMFSFHATKVFNTIEGGAVCYKDDSLTEILDQLKNFGFESSEECAIDGGNAKMTEFQAAMGICNLRHVKNDIAKRKKVVDYYHQLLGGIEGLILTDEQEDVVSNYSYYPVVFDGYKYTRNEVHQMLKENGIVARKYFYPLTSDFRFYKGNTATGSETTPIAKHLSDRVLTLPLYADLPLVEVERICRIIKGEGQEEKK